MLHSEILNKKSGSKIARLNDIGNIYAKKIELEKHKYVKLFLIKVNVTLGNFTKRNFSNVIKN